ncbi:ribosome maturation factor RimP [Sporichthya brevicatena]|uniref:Ribosome maturation factor RimP n=1 Tax=Sporichthya brevicatena TaxID=171442 RepID=A0ABP3SBP3_9ACTN
MAAETLPVRIERLIAPVVTAAGLDLESVEVTPAGRRRVLRVVVDRDGGIDLDGVAEVSRAVSDALDASDVMGGQAYVLEVTSPGTDRPLTAPRHWRRAVGRLVKAELTDGTTRTARVLEGGEDGAVLADGPIAYSEVRRARVEVEFGRPEAGEDPGLDAEIAAEIADLQGEED